MNDHPSASDDPRPGAPDVRLIDSRQVFGDRQEVWIEHEGVRYCLRITRRGRLILTK